MPSTKKESAGASLLKYFRAGIELRTLRLGSLTTINSLEPEVLHDI
jgi:hypothetical protein